MEVVDFVGGVQWDCVNIPSPPNEEVHIASYTALFASAHRAGKVRRAFTLVELLVVIGIIALLISILMPALRRAREQAYSVSCQSNLRQLAMGFILFSNEHKQHLPGGWLDISDPDPEKQDWLLGNSYDFLSGPQNGTAFRYVNSSMGVYRCPALTDTDPGTGMGSNGRFDYAVPLIWAGATISKIKPESRFRHNTGVLEYGPTPLIVEEDPRGWINMAPNVEGGHAQGDQMAHTHWGGCNYASIDGSVRRFIADPGSNALAWETQAPVSGWRSMGVGCYWAGFNGL